MSIAFESTDELEQLRQRLRKMSDGGFMRFGKAARNLCRDPRCSATFKRQLEEARAEWSGGIRKWGSDRKPTNLPLVDADVNKTENALLRPCEVCPNHTLGKVRVNKKPSESQTYSP